MMGMHRNNEPFQMPNRDPAMSHRPAMKYAAINPMNEYNATAKLSDMSYGVSRISMNRRAGLAPQVE